MLPVPTETIPEVWDDVVRFFRHVPGYDIQRLHHRLLTGTDKLWLAILTVGTLRDGAYAGVVVTTITNRPPSIRKCFQRTDPAQMRSLTVHLAHGGSLRAWLDSAVERITAYGLEQGCRQLFLLARKGWRSFAMHFYSTRWDSVAYARDRVTKAKGEYKRRQMVGFYRPVVPIWSITRRHYNTGSICPIDARLIGGQKEGAA